MRTTWFHRITQVLALAVCAVLFVMAHRADAAGSSPATSGSSATPVTTPAVTDTAPAPAVSITPVTPPSITAPGVPNGPGVSSPDKASISIDVGSVNNKPSQSVLIIIVLTLLSVAPSLFIMMTSFTRIVIVLALTRNAIGLQGIPPNQVVVGLALFLSLFVMGPTLSKMNEVGLQPLLKGQISQGEAYNHASQPLKEFMLANTRRSELSMLISVSGQKQPADPKSVSMATLIPAFILSELKTAFIIGFVVFIPFLVIDLIVSSVLMALGMMMLPPVFVSLPFKLLLFVMVDGWSLIAESLVRSFH